MFFSQNITSAHGSWCTSAPKTLQREPLHNLKILTSFKILKISTSFNKLKKYDFTRDKHRAPVHLNQKMRTGALYYIWAPMCIHQHWEPMQFYQNRSIDFFFTKGMLVHMGHGALVFPHQRWALVHLHHRGAPLH